LAEPLLARPKAGFFIRNCSVLIPVWLMFGFPSWALKKPVWSTFAHCPDSIRPEGVKTRKRRRRAVGGAHCSHFCATKLPLEIAKRGPGPCVWPRTPQSSHSCGRMYLFWPSESSIPFSRTVTTGRHVPSSHDLSASRFALSAFKLVLKTLIPLFLERSYSKCFPNTHNIFF